jgi:hypothetical protein
MKEARSARFPETSARATVARVTPGYLHRWKTKEGLKKRKAMTNNNTDKPGKTERDLLSIRLGAEQALTGGRTISYKGMSYDQASLTRAADASLGPYQSVHRARTILEQVLSERRAGEASAQELVQIVKLAAAAAFGEDSVEFSLFGFQPKKKAVPLTPEQKQHKLEQLRATRKARKTMGRRQKQAVKGVVSSGGTAGPPAAPEAGTSAVKP